jgi:integrase
MENTSLQIMLETIKRELRAEVENDIFAKLSMVLGADLNRDNIEDAIEYLKATLPKSPTRFIHSTQTDKKLEMKIDSLKPRPDKMYMRALGDGLQIRIYPSGRKSFAFRYMINNRRTSPIELGPYVPKRERTNENMGIGLTVDEAISATKELRRKLEDKKDPRHFVSHKGVTLQKLYDLYRQEYFKAKTDAGNFTDEERKKFRVVSDKYHRRMTLRFQKFLLPDLGGRPVINIDSIEVQAILDAVEASNGRATADEVRKALSGLIEWATKTKKYKGFTLLDDIHHIDSETKERYVLTIQGIKEFHDYLNNPKCPIPKVQRRILWAMFLIGSRNQETAGGMWDEVDLNSRLWIIPARRMKGREPGSGVMGANGIENGIKRPHVVFVTDLLLETFGAPSGLAIYPKLLNSGEQNPDIPSSSACPQDGINLAKESELLPFPFTELTAYALRHTFSSHMDSLGYTPLDYGRCQSHSDSSTKTAEKEAQKLGYGMTSKKHYTSTNMFRGLRRKAEVWIAWEAEICKLLGRPIPSYDECLLEMFEELGKPGNDETYFSKRPRMFKAINKP